MMSGGRARNWEAAWNVVDTETVGTSWTWVWASVGSFIGVPLWDSWK